MTEHNDSLIELLKDLDAAYEWMCPEDQGKFFALAWEKYIDSDAVKTSSIYEPAMEGVAGATDSARKAGSIPAPSHLACSEIPLKICPHCGGGDVEVTTTTIDVPALHCQDCWIVEEIAHKPVSVSLEKCAKAAFEAGNNGNHWSEAIDWMKNDARRFAKAVLDAAGVNYVE